MNNRSIKINDFHTVCHICLERRENMECISSQILHMITECTSVQENILTKLPQQICNNCYWELKNSYEFKRQYLLSREFLFDILIQNGINETELVLSIQNNLKEINRRLNTNESNNELLTEEELLVKIESKEETESNCQPSYDTDHDDINYNSKLDEYDENSDENIDDTEALDLDELNNSNDEREIKKELVNGDNCSKKSEEQKQKSLADILKKEYKIYDLTCNICKKELSTRATLLRHLETHSKDRPFKYYCPVCNKGFFDRGNLNKHINRHEGKADYKCDICSKRYYELSALALHNKEKHKAQPVKCEKCTAQFYHYLQLQQHEQTHEQKEYICDVCGKVFNVKYKLKDHQVAHSEIRPHKCQVCNKGFKHKFTLTAHIKMRHEDTERRQMCFICGKLFFGGLAKHLESHDKSTINKCESCDRIYTTRSGLQVHIKEKHTTNPNKERYTCNVCNKSLGTKGTLTKHMMFVHSDIRKSCHLCGKMYKTQKNVDAHVAATHMDIRPFSCTMCSKAFHTKILLKNHMRSHTGERPFKCDICKKAFGYREVLRTHMKVHNK